MTKSPKNKPRVGSPTCTPGASPEKTKMTPTTPNGLSAPMTYEWLNSPLERMEQALGAFGRGEFVLVMDAAEREDECDLIIAAESCTKEQMAFMIKHSTGIVCLTTTQERLESFGLHPATASNTDKNGTNFYVSTDYIPGTTTGVSAQDRVTTLRAFCDSRNPPESFSKPGHMFPLCANPDGVLARGGHTESTFDFCRLAPGIKHPVGALAELMHEDGEMFRDGDSREFSKEHNIPMVYVSDIVAYRRWKMEHDHRKLSASLLRTPISKTVGPHSESIINVKGVNDPLRIIVTSGDVGYETVALVKGDVRGKNDVAVRLHSECFTGDTLASQMCDCGSQLQQFYTIMNQNECAVLVYLKGHEGRGIGLYHKIQAYDLQRNEELDTVEANEKLGFQADCRDFQSAVDMLKNLGINSVDLYSNNPDKIGALKDHFSCKLKPLPSKPNRFNMRYLETKKIKQGHMTIMENFCIPLSQESTSSINKIVIISTLWNAGFVNPIVESSETYLKQNDVQNVVSVKVPGHMELLAGTRCALRKHCPDAIIIIGLIIPGESETGVHQYNAVTTSLHELSGSQDVPIIQGVTLCKTEDQALERSAGTKNPGKALAMAALNMIEICKMEDPELTREASITLSRTTSQQQKTPSSKVVNTLSPPSVFQNTV